MLTYLAYKMYTDTEYSDGVTRFQLEDAMASYFRNQYSHDATSRAAKAARQVVDFITGRAWVMTDRGTDVYNFTHRTFMGYFVASYLDDMYETIAELLDAIHLEF